MKIGARLFAPRLLTTSLTLVTLLLLLSLGRWQLQRAHERQQLFDAFDRGTDSTMALDLGTAALPRYQHVQMSGYYDSSRQVLIDNMTDAQGRAGYFVITPFVLAQGGWVLVNRGWVPVGASRTVLPSIDAPHGRQTVRGRADRLPVPGIRLGARGAPAASFPVVADFPSHAEFERLLRESYWAAAAEVVELDPDQPGGYLRRWQPGGFSPVRNLAYAVQWFALALTLAVIYVTTNLRRVSDVPDGEQAAPGS